MKIKGYDVELLFGSSFENSDMLYASGFFAGEFTLVRERNGRKTILTGGLEYGRALKTAEVNSVILANDLLETEEYLDLSKKSIPGMWDKESALIGALLKQIGAKKILVPSFFPFRMAELLKKRGFSLVSKASSPFFSERRKKAMREICLIEKMQTTNEKAMWSAINAIKKSEIGNHGELFLENAPLTAERIKSLISGVFLKNNCWEPVGSIVACGDQGCDPHEEGSGVLKANQSIVIDIFPRSRKHGYWADMTRTVVKGEVSEELKRMYTAVYEAKELARMMVKPGMVCSDIHKAAAHHLESGGFRDKRSEKGLEGFIHGLGHGLGLDIHEEPYLNVSYNKKLEPGDVVTLEPGLYYFGIGAVRLEDLVVVTEDGCDLLTNFPEILVIP